MWSFAEEGSHATEGGGFVTSGAMLHFVKERILTTDVNKAGKTIVPLVVVAINLLFFFPPLIFFYVGKKSDGSVMSPLGPGKDQWDRGHHCFLTRRLQRKLPLPFLLQREEAPGR